jgi:hypothetical protein
MECSEDPSSVPSPFFSPFVILSPFLSFIIFSFFHTGIFSLHYFRCSLSPKLAPKGLMDNKSRPADILLNNLEGRSVVVDVTVYTPSIQIQPLAATTSLARAAAEREQSKHSKYLLLEEAELVAFPQEPLAVRHWGSYMYSTNRSWTGATLQNQWSLGISRGCSLFACRG